MILTQRGSRVDRMPTVNNQDPAPVGGCHKYTEGCQLRDGRRGWGWSRWGLGRVSADLYEKRK